VRSSNACSCRTKGPLSASWSGRKPFYDCLRRARDWQLRRTDSKATSREFLFLVEPGFTFKKRRLSARFSHPSTRLFPRRVGREWFPGEAVLCFHSQGLIYLAHLFRTLRILGWVQVFRARHDGHEIFCRRAIGFRDVTSSNVLPLCYMASAPLSVAAHLPERGPIPCAFQPAWAFPFQPPVR